jgi:type IV secretory pathway VirB10-like protein
MASLGRKYKHGDHDTTQRGGTLQYGNYLGVLAETDIKDNSHSTGRLFVAEFQIVEPESFNRRKIFLNVNIEHEKPDVQKIGEEEFAKIMKAAGIPDDQEIEETEELEGREFVVTAGPDPKDPARTKIFRYFYPEDDQPELGPIKQGSPARGRRDEPERGRREERSREPSRNERTREPSRDTSRGRDDGRDSDRSRSRDREEPRGRSGRDTGREERGVEDDDIPFDRSREERGGKGGRDDEVRSTHGGDEARSTKPWANGRKPTR